MKQDYLNILSQFTSKRILVIGDFILDVFLKGTSTRLSPEAPVPVVDINEKIERPGGAANTAINLKSLGAEVTLLSVIGCDDEGNKAVQLIHDAGINSQRIVQVKSRQTIVKSRVLIGTHALTRLDSGTEADIDPELEQILIQFIQTDFCYYDAIILSDYNKGIITREIVKTLVKLQSQKSRFIAIDSKRLSFFKKLKPSFVKPNYEEAIALLKLTQQQAGRVEQLQCVGQDLAYRTGSEIAAITLDKDGAVIFNNGAFIHQAFTPSVNLPSVTGAGDTFMSTFALAAISSSGIELAADISCIASYIAIRKEGTASCSWKELWSYFMTKEKQIESLDELHNLCSLYHAEEKRIVFTNGCFDILHSGHVSYLNRARQLGDILIVGVNNDASIRRLKGEKRPINPLADRIQVLSGLSAVDHVFAFGDESDDTPISLIKAVRPALFVKGGDYSRDRLPEADTVEQCGGEIVFLSLVPAHSTTQIIQQIHKTSTLAVA